MMLSEQAKRIATSANTEKLQNNDLAVILGT